MPSAEPEGLPPWTAADDRAAFGHSPHLAQWPLSQQLQRLLRSAVARAGAAPRVLELGAGHGPWSAELLALGADVTLVEMDPTGLAAATARCGAHDRWRGHLDPAGRLDGSGDGSGDGLGDGFDVAVVVSVLHHVPDYLEWLARVVDRLRPGGALLTVQDPLFYPRLGPVTRRTDRAAYLAWRLHRGEVRAGLHAMVRRARGDHPVPRPGELTYYHVVRDGVDERAVVDQLAERFAAVRLTTYWSNHLAAAAPLAQRLGLRNTFAVHATGLRAAPPGAITGGRRPPGGG